MVSRTNVTNSSDSPCTLINHNIKTTDEMFMWMSSAPQNPPKHGLRHIKPPSCQQASFDHPVPAVFAAWHHTLSCWETNDIRVCQCHGGGGVFHLQGCFGGRFESLGLHMNVMIQGFQQNVVTLQLK